MPMGVDFQDEDVTILHTGTADYVIIVTDDSAVVLDMTSGDVTDIPEDE